MSLGKIIAKAALRGGKYTSWFPSYGAEMRGGTAHCFVKVSDVPIASPLVEHPDVALFFNYPSWLKFRSRLKPNALVICNTDLMQAIDSQGVDLFELALNSIAKELGSERAVNMIALGALLSLSKGIADRADIELVIEETFNRQDVCTANKKAIARGVDAVIKKNL